MKIFVCLTGAWICFISCSFGQADSTLNAISQLPNKLFAKINKKTSSLDDQLSHQTEKYLERLARKEKKIQQKLYKTDSNAAKQLFSGVQEKYLAMEQQLKATGPRQSVPLQGEYLANIDSVKTSLAFLQQHQNLLGSSGKSQQALANAVQQFNQLQSKFQQTDQINAFLQQRKQQLKNELVGYSQNLGLGKYLNEYNSLVFYASEQAREYKEMFNDPEKMMQEALVVLNKIPAFQTFLRSNSQLAGILGISADYGAASGVAGLQTRDQVQALIQSKVSSGGSGGIAAIQSNLQAAHQQLDQFKDKLSALGGGSGDMSMPEFKPNPEKTHSFLKRIVIGTNLQTTRTSYYYPTTTDIGLSLGFLISAKNTIGVGGSYKIGWGSAINHVSVSSSGASLRSFIDLKIKASNFYASGGLEYNYEQPISNFQQIKSLARWTQSGLIGVTKEVSLGGKLVKKTKVQLFWDILSYSQVPRNQPFIFRIGYSF